MTTVCLDCRYLKPRPSGIGAMVEQLVLHLPDLAPDIEFLLLRHSSRKKPLSLAENVREIELSEEANSPATMWWLPRLIDLEGVELFHSPSNILPSGLKMRTVTTVHDLMWLDRPDLCSDRIWGRVERLFYSHGIVRALKQSDQIVTVSEATREAIVAHKAPHSEKTRVILPGVASTFRPIEIDDAREATPGLPRRPYILAVGQFAPYKNHEGAIRGFAEAFKNDSDIDLVIVQRQGHGTKKLERLAKKLGIAGRVHLRAPVDDEVLVTLYNSATALLHPSFCEGFGMPVAEAMACGCPVITSNLSAMPEVTAGAALLVDPHDDASIAHALRRLVNDSELARDMACKGVERARELNWREFAKGYLSIYRELL